MKLIIQIPCFNEATTLPLVLADLPAQIDGIDTIETLVIDDGSTDGTSEIAKSLGVTHIVKHLRNRGLAESFATGIRTCLRLGADIIVNTDGDNQYSGHDIVRLVFPILQGQSEIVVGDRSPAQDRRFSLGKRWLQWLGAKVISNLACQPLADPVSGFRAFSREAAFRFHLVSKYSYTIDLLLQASHKRIAIDFIPVKTNNPTRPSRLFRSISQFVRNSVLIIVRVFFLYHSLAVLSFVSSVLAVIGVVPIGRFLWLWFLGQGNGHVQSLVLGSAMLILSGLVLLAGMLSDLIASNRIMIEETLERTARMEAELEKDQRNKV
jgi:glycosyltransferase involved in cell wall biosynthesis